MKRILSLTLIICLIAGLVPMSFAIIPDPPGPVEGAFQEVYVVRQALNTTSVTELKQRLTTYQEITKEYLLWRGINDLPTGIDYYRNNVLTDKIRNFARDLGFNSATTLNIFNTIVSASQKTSVDAIINELKTIYTIYAPIVDGIVNDYEPLIDWPSVTNGRPVATYVYYLVKLIQGEKVMSYNENNGDFKFIFASSFNGNLKIKRISENTPEYTLDEYLAIAGGEAFTNDIISIDYVDQELQDNFNNELDAYLAAYPERKMELVNLAKELNVVKVIPKKNTKKNPKPKKEDTVIIENIVTPLGNGFNGLANSIYLDTTRILENKSVSGTIKYKNINVQDIDDVVLELTLPEGITASNIGEGIVSENTVTWAIGTLLAQEASQVTFKLTASDIEEKSVEYQIISALKTADELEVSEMNKSQIRLDVYNIGSIINRTKYVNGYPDNTFKPNDEITRGEIATMFTNFTTNDSFIREAKKFDDVLATDWYYQAVTKAYRNGYFDGYPNSEKFSPNAPISRAELARVIMNYLNVNFEKVQWITTELTDVQDNWYTSTINETERYLIDMGYKDGTFKPNANITRIEAVEMINAMLNRGAITNQKKSFDDIDETYEGLGAIVQAANTFESVVRFDGSELMMNK